MAFDLSTLGSAISAALSGVGTGAFTALIAGKLRVDRNANSCLIEAQNGSNTVSGIVSTGNGTSFLGQANYATNITSAITLTVDVWVWFLMIGDGTSLHFYWKADSAGGSWTEMTGSPVTQTAHPVLTFRFGDNGRGEPFFGRGARLTAYKAVKTPANMIPEISSRSPIDTDDLVLFKLGAGTSLSAALADGVGTVTTSGTVTLVDDMPATLATVEEEEPPLLSGSADIDLDNPDLPDGVAPTITTTSLPAGQVGVAYSQQLVATGTDPITWGATGLPAGLSLSSTGLLAGTPSESGAFAPSFTATNDTDSDAESLSLTIEPASVGVPTITTRVLLSGVEGEPYEATFAASGAGPITWHFDGLFPGAVVDGATISGTPTHSGLYLILAIATNAGGSSTPVTISLLINPPAADAERYASPWAAALRR